MMFVSERGPYALFRDMTDGARGRILAAHEVRCDMVFGYYHETGRRAERKLSSVVKWFRTLGSAQRAIEAASDVQAERSRRHAQLERQLREHEEETARLVDHSLDNFAIDKNEALSMLRTHNSAQLAEKVLIAA